MAAPMEDESSPAGSNDGDVTPSEAQEATSHPLRLPAELRVRIYQLVVVENKLIEIVHHKGGIVKVAESAQPPALARVSRQLNSEVLDVFYSENTFKITLVERPGPGNGVGLWFRHGQVERKLDEWLAGLSEVNQDSLKPIRVCVDVRHNNDGVDELDCRLFNRSGAYQIDGRDFKNPFTGERAKDGSTGWQWKLNVAMGDKCDQVWTLFGKRTCARHHLLVRMN